MCSSSGKTAGSYELQIRLREKDEVPGSTVRYADIRFATDGIRILGQPTHSPLQGEFSEYPSGDISNEFGNAPDLGNVLNTDHGALSISAALDREDDVDWFRFDVIPDAVRDTAIENPGGPLVFEGGTPIIFDLDYSDDNGGGNTRLSIFNAAGQLVLFSDDSNITDDRPAGNEPGGDADDKSRGSVGAQDPYIGPIELPAGTYYAAVTSKALLPSALEYLLEEPGAGLDEVRLEPVNSVERIADEGFDNEYFDVDQATAAEPITDLFNEGDLSANVVPWELSDVALYVTTAQGLVGTTQTLIRTADAFTGLTETVVGPRVSGVQPVGDIATRYDGELFGFATGPDVGPVNDASTQAYLNFATGDGAATPRGATGINTFFRDSTGSVIKGNTGGSGFGFNVDAVAFVDTSLTGGLFVGHRNFPGTQTIEPMNENVIFYFNVDSGRAAHTENDVTSTGGFHADYRAGSNRRAIGFIDTVGDGTTGLDGGLGGRVTGIAFPDASRFSGSNGFGITDRGELHAFQPFNSASSGASGSVRSSFMADIGALIGQPGISFQGLAAGPDDIEPLLSGFGPGRYEDILFAVSSNGLLVAIDVGNVDFNTGSISGPVALAPVLRDGQSFIQMTDSFGFPLNGVTGLDFGTLTENLWHVSIRDPDDPGHGAETPFDFSRSLVDDGLEGQSPALFFGNDYIGSAAGNKNDRGRNNTLDDIRSLDFPNGAAGSIISNDFDLTSFTSADKPILEFNYYLQTEDADAVWGQDSTTGDNNPMRDSFRVFVGGDDGAWNLVATNNSLQEPETNARIDEFDYAPIDPSNPLSIQEPITDGTGTFSTFPLTQDYPDVVELYDDPVHHPDGAGETWYAARIDLSSYAGRDNLRLRFDFSTAGGMDFADGLFSQIDASFNDVVAGDRNEELLALAAVDLRDGERFELDGDGNFTDIDAFNAGSTATVPTGEHFEFDYGHVLATMSGKSIADGDTLNVNGTVFEFEKSIAATAANPIFISDSTSTGDVAASIAAAVDSSSLAGVSAIAVGNRVNFVGATSIDASGSDGLVVDGIAGVRPGHHAVDVTLDMDRESVALAIKTALATQFSATTIDPTNIKGFHKLGYLEIVGHTVSNNGPLGWSNTLPGDEFGAFGVSSTIATGWERTAGALRGVNNRIEGVWLDDIVIGVAERGEVVTNAPAGVTDFVVDTRLYGDRFINGNVDRDHPNYIGTPNNVDQLTGAYTLEIRQASNFAVQDEDFPIKTHLFRSFDTNDRLSEALTLNVPTIDRIADGDLFTLSDGIDELTFELIDIAAGGVAAASNVAIPFDSVADGFKANSDAVVADTIASILNSSTVSNVLAISATAIDGRVEIFGNVRMVVRPDATPGVTGRIANDVETTHQTAPLGPFDTFQLENTSASENIASAVITLPEGQFFDVRDTFSATALYEGADPVASPFSDNVGATFFSDPAMTIPLTDGSRTAYLSFTDFAPGDRYHFNVGVSHFIDRDYLLLLPQFRKSATADSGSRHLVGTELSVTFDSRRTTIGKFHDARLVDFDNGVSEAVLGASVFDVTIHNLLGDRNIERQQGQIIIHSNTITDSANFAIVSGPGESDLNNHTLGNFAPGAGILAGQGAARNSIELNDRGLVPGVVIENNIIARGGLGGIDFGGDPNGVAPFGRIVNNTILGPEDAIGTGIQVRNNASPTVINNAIARLETGISIDASSATAGTVTGANFYVDNANDHGGVAGYGTFDASDRQTGNPDWTVAGTFVDAAVTNLYPAPGSPLIDSSLDSLNDRTELVTIRDPLGIAASPVFAPDLDGFGQTRADDDAPGTGPGAPGANVRKDRGAIDRVDFETPRGTVLVIDTRLEGAVEILDEQGRLDNSGNTILEESDTAAGEIGRLGAGAATAVRQFVLRFSDVGIGIDDAPILAAVNDTSGEIPLPFTLQQDGETLIEGTDYFFVWNSNTDEAIFTHLTEFPLERLYTILVDNDPASGARTDLPGSTPDPHPNDGMTGIRDHAGNFLEINQADGSTQFTILLTDGVNDPPIHSVPGERQSVGEDSSIIFGQASGNAITVFDADVHLAADPVLTTTITATNGRLTLGNANVVTFPSGGTGVDEVSITITGTMENLATALDGLRYTPDAEYFNLLPGEAADANPDPATITVTTNDGGRFSTGNTPASDTDIILVDVLSVNDVPTFDTPVTPPPATEEDGPAVLIPSFITGISTGSLQESSQRVEFTVTTSVVSGNVTFTQEPVITPAGALSYQVSPDTNGTVQFNVIATDFDDNDPNHVSASSDPLLIDVVVNSINDAPIFTVDGTVAIDSIEDEGAVGPFSLISSFSAGPAAATDETLTPATRQSLTFVTSTPITTVGNLTLDSVSVVDGKLRYAATPDTSGTVTFQLSLMDDGSISHVDDRNTSGEQTITVNVAAQPDAPVPASLDYVVDVEGSLSLDASGTTDADLGYAGIGITESLTYSWDLNNDGTYDIVNAGSPTMTVPYATLTGLGLIAPSTNTITLQVTDTFSGTAVTTTAELRVIQVDYGDAPDSFGTLLSSGDPAAHGIVDGFHLGNAVDGELDGTVAPAEDDADDGIVFEAGMQADTAIDSASFFTATASAAGKLDIWIDFNNDNTFQPEEHLNNGVSIDLDAGENRVNFPIPAGSAITGTDLWARARFSSAGDLSPIGRATDGEVEDYKLQISPLLQPVGVQHVAPMWSQTSDRTPRLEWAQLTGTPVGANASHRVELRDAQNQIVGVQEDHPFMYLNVSDPLSPGLYTLVVTPFNRAGVAGPTTTLGQFEVVPITITEPSGNVSHGLPTITWNSITQTDHYEVEISSRVTNEIVVEARDVPSNSYTVTNALPLGEYDIRVRAIEAVTGQVGDWSAATSTTVQTAPNVTGPVGTITDVLPTITWDAVPGVASYDVRIVDLTDNVSPVVSLTGITGTATTLTSVLSTSQYSIEVRGVTSAGVAGVWSAPATFIVGLEPVITTPRGRVADATPTISWVPVSGADSYSLEVIDLLTNLVVYSRTGITANQHTLSAGNSLALGNYEVRVDAIDSPATGSTGAAVSVSGTPVEFTVTAPPTVLTPGATIFRTTPEITWSSPLSTVTSEIEIYNVTANATHLTQQGITGNSFSVPTFGNGVGETDFELTPGTYRVRVRSQGGGNGSIVSDWSSSHVFQVGATPILLGPSGGLGTAPYTRTDSTRPTLTVQQSIAGATYKFWLSSVTENRVLEIQSDVQSPRYTVKEALPVGRYRYWVQASAGSGGTSAWSRSYDFDVTTTPVLNPINPSFEQAPIIRWSSSTGAEQTEVTSYQVWINNIDVVPAQIVLVENNVTGREFDVSKYIEGGLETGRYKVWVRGFVEGVNNGLGTVTTEWSAGEAFEIGGRPTVTSPDTTADDTPLITWSPVDGAVSYELYLAVAGSISTPIVRIADLTTTSYQVSEPLTDGVHYAWIRARSATGVRSPWSLNSESRFTVNPVTKAVVDPVPDGSDRTPTFTWSPVTGADRYEIFISAVATSGTPIVRDANITTTSYTPNNNLPAGDFRVWVRAIGSSGQLGAWSAPVRFMLTDLDVLQDSQSQVPVLASLNSATELSETDSDFGRSERFIPSTGTSDSTGRHSSESLPAEGAVVSEIHGVQSAVEADEVMSNWDDEIWAEESTGFTSSDNSATAVPSDSDSTGWLAGLALLSPSVFRRGKKGTKQS